MSKNKVKKRLISLCLGELTATITFVVVFIFTLGLKLRLDIDLIMVYPFCGLIFVLLQGSFYWYYCIRKIDKMVVHSRMYINIYRILKNFDDFIRVLKIKNLRKSSLNREFIK